jgi:hypothetical protein
VLEGLRAGDRVVVHSEKPLDARSRIRVVDQVVDPRSGQAGATP